MKLQSRRLLAFLLGVAALILVVASRARGAAAQPQRVFPVTLDSILARTLDRGRSTEPLWSTSTMSTTVVGGSDSCTYPVPGGMCVYHGDLHSHTGYSDGEGTPQEAYEMARANGLNFLAVTDHGGMLKQSEWDDIWAQAWAATVEGQFVGLRAFEWTSGVWGSDSNGHVNVLNTADFITVKDPDYDTLGELYAWLIDPVQANAVAVFNHPYRPSDSFDNLRYDPLVAPRFKLIEMQDGDSLRTAPFKKALFQGWHVGPANDSDTHRANWGERPGRNGIIVPDLTYHQIINALRARRIFATQDKNLVLAVRANGYWMGSVIPNEPVYFEVYASAPDPGDSIATLQLYKNNYVFKSTEVNADTATWRFSLPGLPVPGTWWYVKATQSDGNKAYSAPIWAHSPITHDVLIRDNMWDVGELPSVDASWQSPDIWVRREADGQIWHQNPVAGETNYLHARVQNIGSNPLEGVEVYFYWANPSLGLAWPDSWNPINDAPVQVRTLAPGETATVSVPWDVSFVVPPHVCLLGRLVSVQDPIRYEGDPRWDNNIGWKSVHIVELSDGRRLPDARVSKTATLYLANPFAEDKMVDVRISSDNFPPKGTLELHLDAELFDRWAVTSTDSLVRGAVVDPVSKVIAVTSTANAAVYGLPLQAGESSLTRLVLGMSENATFAVRVTEEIDGEEIGGHLYTTPLSGVPHKILFESTKSAPVSQDVDLTAIVVGEGFVPVLDGTEVRFSATTGTLSADTASTQGGLATVMLSTGSSPGTTVVQAGVSGLFSATALIDVCRTCWARLNDDPTDYTTVQAAVDASTHPTDVVKIAGYCVVSNAYDGLAQVAYISKTLTVRGGYTTTNWMAPDPVANPTVLDGRGQGRVLYVIGGPGAGPVIENLYVVGGDASGLGGGVSGSDAGGGVYVDGGVVAIRNSWVLGNSADDGGGLYLSGGNVTLVNNVVADNQVDGLGSGLYVEGGAHRWLHTTIARNHSAGLDGGGVYVTNDGANYATVSLTNTILVSHTVGITVTTGNVVALEATLWGGGAWANGVDWGGAGTVIAGAHNYWGDPAFVDPAIDDQGAWGDYHISADSAALDAGVDAGVNEDVDGGSRPTLQGYDIGADELRVELAVTKRAAFDPIQGGGRLTYTVQVDNVGDAYLHATVTDTLPMHIAPGETAGGTLILPGGTLTWAPVGIVPGGTWTQTVVVTVETGYAGPLTNVVRVTTEEGATGIYTHTLMPDLTVTKRASPDPAPAGGQLAYTVYVTNTGNFSLHATVIDTLPNHIVAGTTAEGTPILPGGMLTWTPVSIAPGGVWTETVIVTVEAGYVGPLTNVVQVTTEEGATGIYTETSNSVATFYFPTVMRDFLQLESCAPRLIREVSTGPEPRGIALDAASERVFIAHAEGITVINIKREAVIATTDYPTTAIGIAYDADRDRIWVARRDPDGVVVLDGTTYAALAELPSGDAPHSVAYNPTNGHVYVTNYNDGTVRVYDAETLTTITTLTGFTEPAHMAVNPQTNKVYVANHWPGDHLTVINGATENTHQISIGLIDSYGVAVDMTRNLIYVAAIAQGSIAVVDGGTDEQLGTLDVRRNDGQTVPLRVIAVNPDVGAEGHLLVVTSSTDGGSDQLLLIPNGWPTWGTPVPLDIASYPQEGIVLDPVRDRVWVTSLGSGLVSVIQDGEPVCPTSFARLRTKERDTFYVEVPAWP